jgi:death-on-curing protein
VSTPPVGIDARAILFLHDESLATFGGARGLRDAGLLQSALARPVNHHLYKPGGDVADLAAAYAFGLAKNHPFVDGNKRTAFLVFGLFLALNGWKLETTQIDAIDTMLSLAKGTLDENALAAWVRGRIVGIKGDC